MGSCVMPRSLGGTIEAVATIGGMERPIDVAVMSTAYFNIQVDRRHAVTRLNLRRVP